MGLLPDNYNLPESDGGGLFAKLESGENRFRIVDQVTTGYIVWEDRKPTRYKTQEDVPSGAEDVKAFWFVPVWMVKNGDIEVNKIQFLEMAQKSVLSELLFLDKMEDWGSLTDYDVIVHRTGKDLETQYSVKPVPKNDMPKAAIDAWKSMKDNYKPEQLFVESGVVYSGSAKASDDDEKLPF